MHAPQSMQPSGSTYIWVAASKAGSSLLGVDAVGRANLNTEGVFDARISDYISHDESVSWNEHFQLAQDQSKEVRWKRAVILITFGCAPAGNG
jgi:hypothetical protein